MPSKQQEFYTQLRQETEARVQTYLEFQKQIESIKDNAKQRIKDLQNDMKFIRKQIEANNELLKAQGQEIVNFGGE